jgi:hypothetical protein
MPGLVPGIHVFLEVTKKTWMAGTSPAMTENECSVLALSNQMRAGIHPNHFAGHVARSRRGEKADQFGDIFCG